MQITVIRGDSGLWVKPAPPYLLNYLQYTRRSFGKKFYQTTNEYKKFHLYSLDGEGGIFTLPGFYTEVMARIRKNLDLPVVDDRRTPMPEIDWEAVREIGLRDYQIDPAIEFLTKAKQETGMLLGCGGLGKSHFQAATYAAWNTLNTILAIPYKEVAKKSFTLFKELFPNKHIGLVGNGSNDISRDITITTFASLKNCATEKCQMLLVDELQGSAGDKIQEVMGSIRPIRTFGYTATNTGLFSKADKLLTGLFGEPLIDIDYQEGHDMGAVVPCTVYFVRVPNTEFEIPGSVENKLRNGIMKCVRRNKLVGDVCRAVPNNWQVLIFLDQIVQHLTRLLPFLPAETRYIHRNSNKKHIKELALSPKQQDQNVKDFIDNKIRYLVATDALRAGFDSQNCRVVIQAAGGSSKIEVLQEALRGSRVLPPERQAELGVTEKKNFFLIDFYDEHDNVLLGMSQKREAFYRSQGWKVNIVDKVEQIDWNEYGMT